MQSLQCAGRPGRRSCRTARPRRVRDSSEARGVGQGEELPCLTFSRVMAVAMHLRACAGPRVETHTGAPSRHSKEEISRTKSENRVKSFEETNECDGHLGSLLCAGCMAEVSKATCSTASHIALRCLMSLLRLSVKFGVGKLQQYGVRSSRWNRWRGRFGGQRNTPNDDAGPSFMHYGVPC